MSSRIRFVDRERELQMLDRVYERGGSLAVVYGRRRVGKTRLLLEWARGKRAAYYHAGPWSHSQNLRELADAASRQLQVPPLGDAVYPSLDVLLRTLAQLLPQGEPAALIIDEFTYWAQSEPRVVAELQRFVDHSLPHTRLTLVLSGSIQGIMERRVLGARAPLYGRARARIRLRPLPPECTRHFAPHLTPPQLVTLHALVGGVPFYLELLEPGDNPLHSYLQTFGPGGPLEDEPLMVYRDEFRDPSPYASLIKALATRGPAGLGKIAEAAGMPTSHASKYLYTLVQLDIARPIPLWGSKRRLYVLEDRMLRSWHALVEPHFHQLQLGGGEELLTPALNRLVSLEWEQLSLEHALRIAIRDHGFTAPHAGRLVRGSEEIDWVIKDSKTRKTAVVEAKWSSIDPGEARKVLARLEARAHALLGDAGEDPLLLLYVRECTGCKHLEHGRVFTVADIMLGGCVYKGGPE